ncbi:MAG TPA: PAS domain S-box protein [Roseiflexaceae bacterium]|nr:PAS domain S-box protein [Roseiflexaceae bacterium]
MTTSTDIPSDVAAELEALRRRVAELEAATVTLGREADEAIRATESRFQTVFQSSPAAISISTLATGLMMDANQRWLELFGYTREEVIGHTVFELNMWAEPQVRQALAQKLTRDGRIRDEVIGLRRKDGSIAEAIISAEPIQFAGELCILTTFIDMTERRRIEQERTQLQEEVIRAQEAAIAELSTPLIPISEHAMVMPLIGSVDSRRAQQVIESLLDGIAHHGARVAILDITGMPVVDTQVANALVRAAQAVKLLGANVIITGIRPEVAQTLVSLGVDLSGIMTHGTLQSGIAFALGLNAKR